MVKSMQDIITLDAWKRRVSLISAGPKSDYRNDTFVKHALRRTSIYNVV